MRFRLHAEMLVDSMDTDREVTTRAEIFSAVAERFQMSETEVAERIEWRLYADFPDARIGWAQTYIVSVRDLGVAGFSDGPMELLS